MNIPLITCSVILAATTAFLPYLWHRRAVLSAPRTDSGRRRVQRFFTVSALVLTLGLAGGVTAFLQIHGDRSQEPWGWGVYVAQLVVQLTHVTLLFAFIPWRTDTTNGTEDTDHDTPTGKET